MIENREKEFMHYKVDTYEVNKIVKKTSTHGLMIDPKDVIEGQEFVKDVKCQACGKLPLKLDIKECKGCRSIICEMCYLVEYTELEDNFLEHELDD